MRAAVVMLAGALYAPVQCASEPAPEERRYETPPEALYQLAERFEKRGDATARRQTLEFLIERYPNSRFAMRAQSDLEKDEKASE